jgi:glutamyl-tRNA reductase
MQGAAALRHLCRVACGLDAAILGEAQVLAQVAGALRVAVGAHTVTPLLKDVFRSAVSVGERARRAVWARYRAADIGWAAAEGAAHALDGLEGATAVVVGAGDVANLAVKALQARGVGRLTVINRTLARAEDIAARHGVDAHDMSALAEAVRSADVVIVATGAGSVVVDAAVVQQALAGRADRPLVVVDAALPRNVDAAVRGLPGAQLLDLTDLRPHFASASDERQEAAAAVEALIEAEVHALLTRRKGWRGESPAARPGPMLASA